MYLTKKDLVTVKVIKGSVSTWDQGSYSKGETFVTTREKALQIDPTFIQIMETEEPEKVEEVMAKTIEEKAEATEKIETRRKLKR